MTESVSLRTCDSGRKETLPYGVDVIGVRRLVTRRSDVARDLAAMMRGVEDHVRQDVSDSARPGFPLRVDVGHGLAETGGSQRSQVLRPEARELVRGVNSVFSSHSSVWVSPRDW